MLSFQPSVNTRLFAADEQIMSLDKYVISLQAFLEDFPEKANNLEGRIRDAATEAEDIIECIMWMDELARIKFENELS